MMRPDAGQPPSSSILDGTPTPRSRFLLTDAFRVTRAVNWGRIASSPLALPLILIVTFVLFIPSLHTYFQGDDFIHLEASQDTSEGTFIAQAFDYRDTRPDPHFGFYRPLFIITYRLCFSVFGLNPTGYHVVSVLLHLGSIALVWLIVRRLLGSVAGANFSALVFAIHPATTEAVQWISRSLNIDTTTFFYLLAMLTFMKSMDGGRYRVLYYVGSLLSFTAAMLFHTTALTLAAVLPAYVFLLAGRPSDAIQWRSWLRFVPFFALTAIMGLIQRHVGLGEAFQTGTFQYSSFGRYLGMALFPVFPQDWNQIPGATLGPLLDLYFLASLVMIAATLILIDRRRASYVGVFAAVWLYVLLAPNTTSRLVDPTTGIIPPQLYLPGISLGLFFIVAAKEVHGLLPPALGRLAVAWLPPILALAFLCSAALTVIHERRDNRFAHQNQTFFAQLNEAYPAPVPGSTLYVVAAPLNLSVFTDVTLIAAVHVYFADVDVKRVTLEQAAYIKAADPTQMVLVFQP